MTDRTAKLETLLDLRERVRAAPGKDRELDRAILDALLGRSHPANSRNLPLPITSYPDGLGACIELHDYVLPGWCWKVGTCCVSDDAWTAPDWNSPEHGERLLKKYGEPMFGTVFDQGVDIDRRPPGNVCLAFLDAILSALIAELEGNAAPIPKQPEGNVVANSALVRETEHAVILAAWIYYHGPDGAESPWTDADFDARVHFLAVWEEYRTPEFAARLEAAGLKITNRTSSLNGLTFTDEEKQAALAWIAAGTHWPKPK